jgi:hypothetical protein
MAMILIPCLACRAGTPADEDASSVSCATCGMALPPPGQAAWLMTRSGSDQYGPYTLAQLAAYIAERRILPGDGIWHQGATVRLNANQLPPFGAVAPAATAPALAPAPAPSPAAEAAAPAAAAPAPVESEPVAIEPAAVAPTPEPAGPAPVQPAPDPAPVAAQPAVAPAPAPATPVYTPAPAYAAPQPGKAGLHLKRAVSWNLRALPVEPDEEARLIANGVDEADARRYLVWRRSVLLVVAIPTLVSALLATLGTVTTDMSSLSGIGILLEVVRLAALFVLPLTAWRAAAAWDNHRRSRTILVRGWLVAFATPLLLALIPFSWRVDLSGGDMNAISTANALLGFVGAVSVYVTLMPAVLSLLPGVLRGCLRIKALLPESILPGLFLVAATPLYVLLFLVIFTTVNQVIGDLLLILGIMALLGAPMLYLINARIFIRPLRTDEEIARVGSIQKAVLTVIGIGLGLIVVYAFTHEVVIPGQMGVRRMALLGFDSSSSLLQLWKPSVIQFPIEYLVRSLFTTVLVADLFMLMNLQLWRHTKEFQASPESASYDRLMSEIEEAGGTPQQAAPTA